MFAIGSGCLLMQPKESLHSIWESSYVLVFIICKLFTQNHTASWWENTEQSLCLLTSKLETYLPDHTVSECP